jgi:exonuclease III
MIVCFHNIRGLGSRVKRRYVKELIQKERIDFLAIQETKIEVIHESLVFNLWGGVDCD